MDSDSLSMEPCPSAWGTKSVRGQKSAPRPNEWELGIFVVTHYGTPVVSVLGHLGTTVVVPRALKSAFFWAGRVVCASRCAVADFKPVWCLDRFQNVAGELVLSTFTVGQSKYAIPLDGGNRE